MAALVYSPVDDYEGLPLREVVGGGPSPRGPRSLGAIGSRAAGDRTTLPYLRVVALRLTGPVGAGRLPAAHLGARPGASVTTSIPAQYRLHCRTSPIRRAP